ncbi:hypothetical protein F4802DRAFT_107453 [Xylaria palmicola]|nr:hypothetical protein F4802DRAFT_107453 [Xylaria palmicola]
MEWASDNMGINARDLRCVYKYHDHGNATIVEAFESGKEPSIRELSEFLEEKKPTSLNTRNHPGRLVLLIADRISQTGKSCAPKDGQAQGLISLDVSGCAESGGQQLTRILPFSQATFERISRSFYVHGSISHAISRADIPLFSHDEVLMRDEEGTDQKAWIYNCRSTNAWGGDLALTVTHFPHRRLSFAVAFGCTDRQRKYIIRQVMASTIDSAHPLLLPGIFAELERQRHHEIFETAIDKLEMAMPNVDVGAVLSQESTQISSPSESTRMAYLEILHIKQGLESWSTQLQKMAKHSLDLGSMCVPESHTRGYFPMKAGKSFSPSSNLESALRPLARKSDDNPGSMLYDDDFQISKDDPRSDPFSEKESRLENDPEPAPSGAKTTSKISRRLGAILDEYSDKIRECQVRFDGITMATQLFQGETNLQLALATNRDARHMKSIALVTMVFLPGTFFATVFSMTFFNWQASGDEPTVSPSIWIYFVFSIALTAVTLLAWYYFGTVRPKSLKASLFTRRTERKDEMV